MRLCKTFLLFTIASLFLCGCASSERMMRMSGDVFGSYDAPKAQRIRSGKYQAIAKHSLGDRYGVTTPTAENHTSPAKPLELNDNLLNIWPFYFQSGTYTSVLWPLIDSDPYGFAFRPFYNHEGDDTSILFPLSSWNSENGFGWCLFCIWGKEGWAVLPLFACTPDLTGTPLVFSYGDDTSGFFFGTPFFIHKWRNEPKLSTDNPFRGPSAFTTCMLMYYGTRQVKRYGQWDFLFRNNINLKYADHRNLLAWHLQKQGVPMPKTQAELMALKARVFSQFEPQVASYYGLFPFFHGTSTPDSSSFSLLWRLLHYKTTPDTTDATLFFWLGGIYSASDHRSPFMMDSHPRAYRKKASATFICPILLSGYSNDVFFKNTPELDTLWQLYSLSWDFNKNKPTIQKLWQKFSPDKPLPGTVVDHQTFELFLADFVAERSYETESTYAGGCLPIFIWDFNRNGSFWCSPLLLSGYSASQTTSSFWSVPLFSYHSHTPEKDFATTGTPLVWYEKTIRPTRKYQPVFSRDTFYGPEDNDCIELQDTHAACWLYYHGKHAFMVAKPGYGHADINSALDTIRNIGHTKKALEHDENQLENRRENMAKWVPKTKIEEYERLIEGERIKIEAEKLEKRRKEHNAELDKLRSTLARLKMAFSPEAIENEVEQEALMNAIFDNCTEKRSFEDFGSGLFYRRELYENGDGYWSFLFGLAGSKQHGDAYEKHVLHFLYKDVRQGNKQELLIFPFISKQQDGDNTRTSFLGRIWQKNVVNGKTSGYILFIPYGEK